MKVLIEKEFKQQTLLNKIEYGKTETPMSIEDQQYYQTTPKIRAGRKSLPMQKNIFGNSRERSQHSKDSKKSNVSVKRGRISRIVSN